MILDHNGNALKPDAEECPNCRTAKYIVKSEMYGGYVKKACIKCGAIVSAAKKAL